MLVIAVKSFSCFSMTQEDLVIIRGLLTSYLKMLVEDKSSPFSFMMITWLGGTVNNKTRMKKEFDRKTRTRRGRKKCLRMRIKGRCSFSWIPFLSRCLAISLSSLKNHKSSLSWGGSWTQTTSICLVKNHKKKRKVYRTPLFLCCRIGNEILPLPLYILSLYTFFLVILVMRVILWCSYSWATMYFREFSHNKGVNSCAETGVTFDHPEYYFNI